MRNLRIVFMGTPEFAVPSLEILIHSSHEVVGVVTAVDKPAGRGKQIRHSAVKECALKHGIQVLQPERLKSPEFRAQLAELGADLFVVVAFRMLPEEVWSLPELGTINLHGSLLPDYRGAAPINRAVMNGDRQTGVSTFRIEKEIDTGKILLQRTLSIGENENAGSVHDRMMQVGAELLLETVNGLAENRLEALDQQELIDRGAQQRPAPKLFKDDCRIDWNNDCSFIHNHIRGLAPYPGAWTLLQTQGNEPILFKILESIPDDRIVSPGHLQLLEEGSLLIGCQNGSLRILSLQMQGKKAMPTEAFLRGYSFPEAAFFE